MSIQVKLENKEELVGAIKQVRLDTSETNWVLVGHANDDPNTIKVEATGTDGFAGLHSRLSNDKAQYALCIALLTQCALQQRSTSRLL
jgi:hypothetical protein